MTRSKRSRRRGDYYRGSAKANEGSYNSNIRTTPNGQHTAQDLIRQREEEDEKRKATKDEEYFAKHDDIRDIPGLRFPLGRDKTAFLRGQKAVAIFFCGPTPPSMENRIQVARRMEKFVDACSDVLSASHGTQDLATVCQSALASLRSLDSSSWGNGNVCPKDLKDVMDALVNARRFYIAKTSQYDGTRGFDNLLKSIDRWTLLIDQRPLNQYRLETEGIQRVAKRKQDETKSLDLGSPASLPKRPLTVATKSFDLSSSASLPKRPRTGAAAFIGNESEKNGNHKKDETKEEAKEPCESLNTGVAAEKATPCVVASTQPTKSPITILLPQIKIENRLLRLKLEAKDKEVESRQKLCLQKDEIIQRLQQENGILQAQVDALQNSNTKLQRVWQAALCARNEELSKMGVDGFKWGPEDLDVFLLDLEHRKR